MVAPMNLKLLPEDVVALLFTSFFIIVSLLAMKSGRSSQTPSLISRIYIFIPTFFHLSLASFYSSFQLPSSCFVSSSSIPTPISFRTLKCYKHFLFIGINPMLHHTFHMRYCVDMNSKGQSSMGSSIFPLTIK